MIKSKLIEGTKPNAETFLKIQEMYGIPTGKSIGFMVFEVSVDRKKVYCCWSGGVIVAGSPKLTLVGQGALEALLNLPLGKNDPLRFQDLKSVKRH